MGVSAGCRLSRCWARARDERWGAQSGAVEPGPAEGHARGRKEEAASGQVLHALARSRAPSDPNSPQNLSALLPLPAGEAKHGQIAPARQHGVIVTLHLTALRQLARFGGGGAAVGPLSKVDLAEEMRKRKERAKKFGLPVPVFAAEVRSRLARDDAGQQAAVARNCHATEIML